MAGLKQKIWVPLTGAAVAFCVLGLGSFINSWNHYVHSLLLIIAAVGLYFMFAFCSADRNWMDIRAVFSGSWMGTLGLASLRLTEYQEPWQTKTWWVLLIAYVMFLVGAQVGHEAGPKLYDFFRSKLSGLKIGKLRLELQEKRLFWICIVTTLIGLTCFAVNVKIKGYIPCFADSTSAYMDFYTKFHVFAVAATGVSGLCYYCIRTQKLSIIKKILLMLCIIYLVFLFPVMVVSRGVFVVAALSLTVVVFYLHGKKLMALILCLVAIFGIYIGTSYLRDYTDEYLNAVFEPAEIIISENEESSGETSVSPEDSVTTESTPAPEGITEPGKVVSTFTLSPRMAFLYGYLTVSHDNFNEAIENVTVYSYGVRQLKAFNTILNSSAVEEALGRSQTFLVRPHLNTTNFIGDFYYDFGVVGVAAGMLICSLAFGIMQSLCQEIKRPFALLVMGNGMVPVALNFFATWMGNFTQWMLWGVVIIFALCACITTKKS